MDDLTPVRVKQDALIRMSTLPDRVWFRLDTDFKGTNRTKIFNGPAIIEVIAPMILIRVKS
jgi:hypothetical protein